MPQPELKGPVLVATDLAPAADEALRQAEALAPGDGTLHVCHVLPEALRSRMLFPQLHARDSQELLELERQAGRRVAERVESVTRRAPERYAIAVDAGSPHGGILRQAERVAAGLVVVGAGATAARVVRGAACPVLVVRPSPKGKVLGATDFSDPSLPALDAAAAEARRRGVPLALVHSVDMPLAGMSVGFAGVPLPILAPGLMEATRRSLADQLEAFSQRVGMPADCLVKEGPAGSATSPPRPSCRRS